ncbi:MAG: hypothetical protein JNK15_01135 [Planctomycetes bacterium]|nr:hypothetical protein [Planctomycetota bacterium]
MSNIGLGPEEAEDQHRLKRRGLRILRADDASVRAAPVDLTGVVSGSICCLAKLGVKGKQHEWEQTTRIAPIRIGSFYLKAASERFELTDPAHQMLLRRAFVRTACEVTFGRKVVHAMASVSNPRRIEIDTMLCEALRANRHPRDSGFDPAYWQFQTLEPTESLVGLALLRELMAIQESKLAARGRTAVDLARRILAPRERSADT